MRISDWSSDVCSSDLLHFFNANQAIFQFLPFRLTGVYCLHERSMDISVAPIAQLFPVALPERFQHHPLYRLGALRDLVAITPAMCGDDGPTYRLRPMQNLASRVRQDGRRGKRE